MAFELSCEVLIAPQITMEDGFVAAASAQKGVVPSNCADAAVVATHSSDNRVLDRIPDLEFTCMGSNSKVVPVSGPLN